MILTLFALGLLCQQITTIEGGILYPKDSESREVRKLDGIWNFRLTPFKDSSKGYKEKWYKKDLRDVGATIPMPVPASYNDLTVEMSLRDHVGVVWYDRKFFVPQSWSQNQRVWLRFSSVCYAAEVWVNGQLATTHEIGHLPFLVEVTNLVKFGEENTITVSVDNTLLQTTIPQGTINELSIGNTTIVTQQYTFDFFNYAGIDRSVHLYTTPLLYIDDVTISTNVQDNNGIVNYKIDFLGAIDNSTVECSAELSDREGNVVATARDCSGTLTVASPKLWWAFLMDPDPGYLYKLKVEITDGSTRDVYRLPVGIRTIRWTNTQLLLNEKPVYIRGVGKHEDSDIRGKGLDLALIVKDYNLLQWLGVNTYRTSHYPYAEEIMDMADEQGIMIIDECPSVDTDIFSDTLLQKHKQSLSELIRRDKNRPSVIIWSVANEPRTQTTASGVYFKQIVDHVKSLDASRPTTIALARSVSEDKVGQYLDIVSFNRYNSWYSNTGRTEIIYDSVVLEAEAWFAKYNKPVLMTEYGADTLAGLHVYPESVWSEEYQILFMTEHFRAFDNLRTKGFFIGEMIWNFADFKTAQKDNILAITRVGGNKKGVFTRQRDPKSSAYYLRTRYHELANELEGSPLPKDLYKFVRTANKKINKTEL